MKSLEEFARQRAERAKKTTAPAENPADQSLEREYDAQFHLATDAENVVIITIGLLRPYANHPFKPYIEEKLISLAESIQREGLHQPILIRKTQDEQGYEILSGHNRVEAMRRLGHQDIPAIIRDADDNTAALIVVTTNLEQREKLLPSEKAFAYRLQMEALQKQKALHQNGDSSSDTNGSAGVVQIEPHIFSRTILADEHSVSGSEIQRYIRLTYLLPELLEQIDQDQIPVMAGYEISFVDIEAQQAVHQHFASTKEKLSIKTAAIIRTAYESGKPITTESIPEILQKPPKKKPPPKAYRVPRATLRQFVLPPDFDFNAFVLRMLEREYQRK